MSIVHSDKKVVQSGPQVVNELYENFNHFDHDYYDEAAKSEAADIINGQANDMMARIISRSRTSPD